MKNSPLHSRHLELKAKMADFGGWLMPIEYPASGVLAEHAAVRERVGLFDVSHLGKASVKGVGALEFLNSMFTNDLNRISDGQAQYTLLCRADGGVIDDLIVYRKSETDFFLIPNASNTGDVVKDLQLKAPDNLTIENLHEDHGVIALQGPLSASVLKSLGVTCNLDYMAFSEITIGKSPLILCRTGYTGEYGFEIIPLRADVETVWDLLAERVLAAEGAICGLGARDTLRTEMGYPLHGHELSLSISPVKASATWAVGWKKGAFQGSDVLTQEKSVGPARRLRGLRSNDRGIPRAEMIVTDAAGSAIGLVTSGTFSPTLRAGIALALVDSAYSIGDEVSIDIRGRVSTATIVDLPFVPSRVRGTQP
jgi:aminomethyltransferase